MALAVLRSHRAGPGAGIAARVLVALLAAGLLALVCADAHAQARDDVRPLRVFRPTGVAKPVILRRHLPLIRKLAPTLRKLKPDEKARLARVVRVSDLRKVLRAPDEAQPGLRPPGPRYRIWRRLDHPAITARLRARAQRQAELRRELEAKLAAKMPQVFMVDRFGKELKDDPAQWVAIQSLDLEDPMCTATLIGPRVMLTAAHCVPPDEDVAVQFDEDEAPLPFDCERHPAYGSYGIRARYDYALCVAGEDMPAEVAIAWEIEDSKQRRPGSDLRVRRTGVKARTVPLRFERLSLSARDALPNLWSPEARRVLLAGYGCSRFMDAVPDGSLRAGFARISFDSELRLVTGSPWRSDSYVICQGDSGGGVFRVRTSADPHGRRLLVAINTANILQRNQSVLSKTSSSAFVRFFHSWRRRMGNPAVCGIDREIEALCRP